MSDGEVIELDAHRVIPGTVWWSGWFRCTGCDLWHVGVSPMPDWAHGPEPMECPGCHTNASLAVVPDIEPPEGAAIYRSPLDDSL